jgi:hypothetical protein
MPMVFKWQNRLYPSISLLLACRYYGIDVTKDVEVKLGELRQNQEYSRQKDQHSAFSAKNAIL